MMIDPCVPDSWDGFKVQRRFRGKILHIEVKNPNHVCKGVVELTLNGEKISGNVIPAEKLGADNTIVAVMGKVEPSSAEPQRL